MEKAVADYIESFYQTGVSSIYNTAEGYVIYIVGNAYNPTNFWFVSLQFCWMVLPLTLLMQQTCFVLHRAGRWREVWHYSKTGSLDGKLSAQVHYYEDGNVQLHANQAFSFSDMPKVGRVMNRQPDG